MVPIYCIVGKSDVGKTTFIEKLIPLLKVRGVKIATVKHDVHGFEMDKEGKDSWRHKKAGSDCVIVASSQKIGMVKDLEKEMLLSDIVTKYLSEYDLVITEGYKRSPFPKIEIFRSDVSKTPLCLKEDGLVAIVTDVKLEIDVPQFSHDDANGVAEFIIRSIEDFKKEDQISLYVNGGSVEMNTFIRSFFTKVIKAMVSSLKGCDDPQRIDISLRINR